MSQTNNAAPCKHEWEGQWSPGTNYQMPMHLGIYKCILCGVLDIELAEDDPCWGTPMTEETSDQF